MGRTACTEPQCLYKGAFYLYLRVDLYLYSLYGPYNLYRASVPVQGCTLPLPNSRAIPLLPLWAARPVQSLSACTRVHLYLYLRVELYLFSPYGPYGLYKGAFYLYLRVDLYFYSLYGSYGLYRASACTRVHFTFT